MTPLGRVITGLVALFFICLCWHIAARAAPPADARPLIALL